LVLTLLVAISVWLGSK